MAKAGGPHLFAGGPPVVLACRAGDAVPVAGALLPGVDRHALTDLQIRLLPDGSGAPPAVSWAHRLVLSAASPVVHAILTATGFREARQDGLPPPPDEQPPPGHARGSEITLGGIAPPVFEKLLDFVYHGAVVLEGLEHLLLLYKAADQLDVQPLRAACLDFVGACLRSAGGASHGGCVQLMLLADSLSLECVRRRCEEHIRANLGVVALASPPGVWRLLPTAAMASIMRVAPAPSAREEQDVHEVVFAAWADWCGGPWARLAQLSMHASRPAPAPVGGAHPGGSPPLTAARVGSALGEGQGGAGHEGPGAGADEPPTSAGAGNSTALHPDLSCPSPSCSSSASSSSSSSSSSSMCDGEDDAGTMAAGCNVNDTYESGDEVMHHGGAQQCQEELGVLPERVDLLQVLRPPS